MSLTIRDERYEGRFFSDVVEGIKFVNCDFDRVTFPSVSNCEFINCEFISCTFPIGGTSFSSEEIKKNPRGLSDSRRNFCQLDFVRCRFTRLIVQGAEVHSCRFLNCKVIEKFDFRDCHFSDYLRFSKCSGVHLISMDNLCSFSETYSEQLFLNAQPSLLSAPTWTSIRFMLKLPVPKIGFSVLGGAAILIPVLNYTSILVFEKLNEARSAAGMNELEPLSVGIPNSIAFLFVLLILLVGVSVAHSIFEPAKIRDYTLSSYLGSVGRSEIEFQSINRSPKALILAIFIGYAIVISALFILYVRSAASLLFM